jgi:membrane protein implicated in regulation of membrane protease activity
VDAKARAVGRLVMALRMAVYFSLGAGLTGLVALSTGIVTWQSVLWSAAGGALTTAVSRLVRRVARRDLDSSVSAADFIMADAEIVIGVEPGKMGKARVRRFGMDRDLYVRSKEPGATLAAGTKVRIVDFDEECYFVEAV